MNVNVVVVVVVAVFVYVCVWGGGAWGRTKVRYLREAHVC